MSRRSGNARLYPHTRIHLQRTNWVDFPLKMVSYRPYVCVCVCVRLCYIELSHSRSLPFWIQIVFHVVFSHGWLWSLYEASNSHIYLLYIIPSVFIHIVYILLFIFVVVIFFSHPIRCSIVCDDECMFSFKWKPNTTILIERHFQNFRQKVFLCIFVNNFKW